MLLIASFANTLFGMQDSRLSCGVHHLGERGLDRMRARRNKSFGDRYKCRLPQTPDIATSLVFVLCCFTPVYQQNGTCACQIGPRNPICRDLCTPDPNKTLNVKAGLCTRYLPVLVILTDTYVMVGLTPCRCCLQPNPHFTSRLS